MGEVPKPSPEDNELVNQYFSGVVNYLKENSNWDQLTPDDQITQRESLSLLIETLLTLNPSLTQEGAISAVNFTLKRISELEPDPEIKELEAQIKRDERRIEELEIQIMQLQMRSAGLASDPEEPLHRGDIISPN